MGNVSVRRAGMASSPEEVSYEFGGLLGISILGSVMTWVYSSTVRFPSGTPEKAYESMDNAREVAQEHPQINRSQRKLLIGGYVSVVGVTVMVLVLATGLTWWLLRHHGWGTRSSIDDGPRRREAKVM